MSIKTPFRNTGIAVLGTLFVAAPAGAGDFAESRLERKVDSCIAEIGNRVSYDDATRVRHMVVVVERRTLGHSLTIKTSIYADGEERAIREYAAKCVVLGDKKPMRFEISETKGAA